MKVRAISVKVAKNNAANLQKLLLLATQNQNTIYKTSDIMSIIFYINLMTSLLSLSRRLLELIYGHIAAHSRSGILHHSMRYWLFLKVKLLNKLQ